MKKQVLGLAAAAAAVCALLAGCSGAATAAAGTANVNTITVNASAEVPVVPDVAEFTVNVVSTADDAEAARDANAQATNAVIDRLKELGVEERSIQTSYTDLSPSWDWENDVITGYEMNTQLTISDVALDEVAALMQECVDAGATGVGGLRFYASSYDEAYQQALALAVEASRPKAEAIAAASGTHLGAVIGVTEGWQDTSARYAVTEEAAAAGADMDGGVAMDIQPGETSVEAHVTVTYAI